MLSLYTIALTVHTCALRHALNAAVDSDILTNHCLHAACDFTTSQWHLLLLNDNKRWAAERTALSRFVVYQEIMHLSCVFVDPAVFTFGIIIVR